MNKNLLNGYNDMTKEEYAPEYLIDEYHSLKVPYLGSVNETVPEGTEISLLAESETSTGGDSTASNDGGGTGSHSKHKEWFCRKCQKPVVYRGRGRPPLECGNCKSLT